jgi:prefoldin subunit 4
MRMTRFRMLYPLPDLSCRPRFNVLSSYKIGDSFISLPLPEVQEMLASSTTKIEEDVTALEEQLGTIREDMTQLKVELYARFGRSINLET